MAAPSNIFLPLNFDQVLELVNQLPKKQKKQLANLLLYGEDTASAEIPDIQKKFVRSSIKKYKKHPELLINDDDAWKMINTK